MKSSRVSIASLTVLACVCAAAIVLDRTYARGVTGLCAHGQGGRASVVVGIRLPHSRRQNQQCLVPSQRYKRSAGV